MRKKFLMAMIAGMLIITPSQQTGATAVPQIAESTLFVSTDTQQTVTEDSSQQKTVKKDNIAEAKSDLKKAGKDLAKNNIANVSILLILVIALGIITKKNSKLKEEEVK